jgi:hypothetical protein
MVNRACDHARHLCSNRYISRRDFNSYPSPGDVDDWISNSGTSPGAERQILSWPLHQPGRHRIEVNPGRVF